MLTVASVTALGLVLAACGNGGDDEVHYDRWDVDLPGQTVSVMGTWSSNEQAALMAVVQLWMDATGATIELINSPDLAADLADRYAAGNLPDIAGFPSAGLLREWFDIGALQPLGFVDLEYYNRMTPGGFGDLGMSEDGDLMGVLWRADVSGLVFYNVNYWEGAPTTFAELNAITASIRPGNSITWCITVESGATSGWPGADWIENILLRQAGPEVYDRWADGSLEWTAPEVHQAWVTFGDILSATDGGPEWIVTTNFGQVGDELFTDPSGCLLVQQRASIADYFITESGVQPDEFSFFVLPTINEQVSSALIGDGEFMGMFSGTPAARSLIQWLITADAQQSWVSAGSGVAANTGVSLETYLDEVTRGAAHLLRSTEMLRFSASSMMPPLVSDAFNRGIIAFIENPDDLDAILASIETVRLDAEDAAG